MVKHAVREEEPILTSEERVNRAMQRVMAGKSFSEEQLNWIGLIREHMIKNLTIDVDDFSHAPIFERHGGISRARKVFNEEFEALIAEINAAVAV